MRIGMFLSDTGGQKTTVDDLRASARWAEEQGLATGWLPHLPWGLDALVAINVAGAVTSRIELASAVAPTYPVHPMGMARLALSTNAAIGGRLALGLGPSHPSVIEGMHGLSYDRPALHTREYLGVLRKAFAASGSIEAKGEFFNFTSMFAVPGQSEPVLLIAALAPLMLQLAGELADGTILWMADEYAIESHVLPRITKAASAAGRAAPRIVAPLPVCVTDDEDAGREQAAKAFAAYTQIPTYQRILARGEAGAPAQIAIVGPEEVCRRRLQSLRDVGVTDFVAAPFPFGADRAASLARTRDFVAAMAADFH